jgi:hypothetical protein
MDVIGSDMPLQNIDTKLAALLPHNRPDPFRDFATQGLVAILGDPDNVQMDRKGGMGAMAIVTHTPESTENLLKLPPKGGGFNPPKRGQNIQDCTGFVRPCRTVVLGSIDIETHIQYALLHRRLRLFTRSRGIAHHVEVPISDSNP